MTPPVVTRLVRFFPALIAVIAVLQVVAIVIGVIATPASSAQAVADLLVDAGVSSILNFAATAIQVPEGVHLRKVDLSTELQILAFHEQQRSGGMTDDLLEGAG